VVKKYDKMSPRGEKMETEDFIKHLYSGDPKVIKEEKKYEVINNGELSLNTVKPLYLYMGI
jgi:hypothetical protein